MAPPEYSVWTHITREDPRGRCARSTRAVYCRFYKLKISPSAKLAFNYGAFGAKEPARAGQKIIWRNFFKKVDFFRGPGK